MEDVETTDEASVRVAVSRKPLLLIVAVAVLYVMVSAPFAVMNFGENWRHVGLAMAVWSVLWLFLTLPLSALTGLLAARLERAETGLRHPKRAAWVGVSVGVLLVAHWLIQLAWTPTQLLSGLTGSHRQEALLFGSVLGGVAWLFAGAGLALAVKTHGALRVRSWRGIDDSSGPRRLPRLPTPWVFASIYLLFSAGPSLLILSLATDEREAGLALFLWTSVGLTIPLIFTAVYSITVRGLPHASPAERPGARFFEQLGAIGVLHWAPFWLFTLFGPLWRSAHTDQLFCAVYSAFAFVLCTAIWSYGHTYRSQPLPA